MRRGLFEGIAGEYSLTIKSFRIAFFVSHIDSAFCIEKLYETKCLLQSHFEYFVMNIQLKNGMRRQYNQHNGALKLRI